MNEHAPAPDRPAGSPDGRIIEILSEFVARWRRGERPRIEDDLQAVPSPDRPRLFLVLLGAELAIRSRWLGEPVTREEYQKRFPDEATTIGDVFDGLSSPTDRFSLMVHRSGGGFGDLWLAHDEQLNREVALKALKPAYAEHPAVIAKFVEEAEIAGALEHPGIPPVYAHGKYPDDDRPYYAMRFIHGDSFQATIDDFHTRFQQRPDFRLWHLELSRLLRRFIDVCYTIDYAHAQGVLHRDLKPANIMLGKFGETVVVDWGAAKKAVLLTAKPPDVADVATSASPKDSLQPGTPSYMCPEQAANFMDPKQAAGKPAGAASDIYSLGATLYCLLTGKSPVEECTVPEALLKVQQGEFPPARARNPRVPPALDAICRNAMAREPEGRYRSARELAEEVERWLEDEPVLAWPERWPARLGRWVRRHRTWVQASAVMLVVVTSLSIGAAVLIDGQRREAAANLAQSRRHLNAAQLEKVKSLALADPGRALDALNDEDRCPRDRRDFAWYYYYRLCHRERLHWQAHPGDIRWLGYAKDGRSLISVGAEGCVRFWNPATGREVPPEFSLGQQGQPIVAAAGCSATEMLAVARQDGKLELWDLGKRQPVAVLNASAILDRSSPGPVRQLAFSGNGGRLASLHDAGGSLLIIWDVAERKPLVSQCGPADAHAVAVSADGNRVAVGGTFRYSSIGGLMVWDGREEERGGVIWNNLVDLKRGLQITSRLTALTFTADSNQLVLASDGGALAHFDLADCADPDLAWKNLGCRSSSAHPGPILALAVPPQGHLVASATVRMLGLDGSRESLQPVKVWHTTRKKPERLTYLADVVRDVVDLTYSPDGCALAMVGKGGLVTVCDCSDEMSPLRSGGSVQGVAFSADGHTLAAAVADVNDPLLAVHAVEHWDFLSGRMQNRIDLEGSSTLLVLPQGQILYPRSDKRGRPQAEHVKLVELLDAGTERVLGVLDLHAGDRAAAVSADRRLVAIVKAERQLELWNLATQRKLRVLDGLEGTTATPRFDPVHPVLFSPTGQFLAWDSGGERGQVGLWEPATGKLAGVIELGGGIKGLDGRVASLAFSVRGETLAIAFGKTPKLGVRNPTQVDAEAMGSVTLWDTASRTKRATLKGHEDLVYALDFSADGRTLATGSKDKTVRLWETTSGLEHAVLAGHEGTVFSAAFAPDGLTLATGGYDRNLALWRAASDDTLIDAAASQLIESLKPDVKLRSGLEQRIRKAAAPDLVRQRALQLAAKLPDDVHCEAQDWFEWLKQRGPLQKDILKQIEYDTVHSAEVRKEAERLAEQFTDKAGELCDFCWKFLTRGQAKMSADERQANASVYALARRYAEVASTLAPDDCRVLNTLGVALYRQGDIERAVATLKKSATIAQITVGEPQPADFAFLAMAHFRLAELASVPAGRRADARVEAMQRLEQLIYLAQCDEWRDDKRIAAMEQEARDTCDAATTPGTPPPGQPPSAAEVVP